jgi:hypothetical protein
MSSLIQHVHDFAREVELTIDEWMAGVELINWAGKMSTDRRNEGQLVCDVIGLESSVSLLSGLLDWWLLLTGIRLVDEITYKKASEAADTSTQSAILGPFFRHDAPLRQKGDTITFDTPKDGQVVYMHGRVMDGKTKKPLANAYIDVWEASTNVRSRPITLWYLLMFFRACTSSKIPTNKTVTSVESSRPMIMASMPSIVLGLLHIPFLTMVLLENYWNWWIDIHIGQLIFISL